MLEGNSHPVPDSAQSGPRRRSTWPLVIVAALFVIVPFLAWYGTWFGRTLSDEKITEYLADETKPRHVQHALAQIAERLEKKDGNVRRWYPQVVALSNSSIGELRSNVAWVMGKDSQAEEFHQALLNLSRDREPIVQRNAALSLVTFGDATGLPTLRSMLQPFTLAAPTEGVVTSVLPEGTPARVGMMLARIKKNENQILEVRAPVPGEISKVLVGEGTVLKAGDELLLVAPDNASVWEALRALYLIGEEQDLPTVQSYAQASGKISEQIKKQAALTAEAIQSRSQKSR
jgi:hypothetical protein